MAHPVVILREGGESRRSTLTASNGHSGFSAFAENDEVREIASVVLLKPQIA